MPLYGPSSGFAQSEEDVSKSLWVGTELLWVDSLSSNHFFLLCSFVRCLMDMEKSREGMLIFCFL